MKTEIKKITLHSKRLLPAFIVDTARKNGEDMVKIDMSDTIMTWVEKQQSMHRFQPNDEVYDMDNLDLKIRVVRVLKKYEKIKIGDKEEPRLRINGIECEYWV